MQLDNNEEQYFVSQAACEKHTVDVQILANVVGSPKRAEQMQTINRIFIDSLFLTKKDVFMINVSILSCAYVLHNPDICDWPKGFNIGGKESK